MDGVVLRTPLVSRHLVARRHVDLARVSSALCQ
jgi:hypothetical protein